MDEELMTPQEVADWLGLHANTIRLWIRQGQLPHYMTPGGHYLLRRRDVQRLLFRNPIDEDDDDQD